MSQLQKGKSMNRGDFYDHPSLYELGGDYWADLADRYAGAVDVVVADPLGGCWYHSGAPRLHDCGSCRDAVTDGR